MNKPLSRAQIKALRKAANRVSGRLCPVVGVHAAAETALLAALLRRGLIVDGPAPRINEAGRAAVAINTPQTEPRCAPLGTTI